MEDASPERSQAHRVPRPANADTSVTGGEKVSTQPESMVNASSPLKTIGRYSILKELGRGGMGAVYLAEDNVLKRQVALKIPQFEPQKAEQMLARFVREAQIASSLSHPNICQIFDVVETDGQHMMAMEYIDGKTLTTFCRVDEEAEPATLVTCLKRSSRRWNCWCR
ncbi:MAG: protein kinase [Planctomycetaceae bacterium]